MALTLKQQIETTKMQLKALEAQQAKESRVTAIELPGGQVLKLAESLKQQEVDTDKAEEAAAIETFKGLGLSESGAKAMYRGREQGGPRSW